MSARVYLLALLATTLACNPGALDPGEMGQGGGGEGGGAGTDSPGTAGVTTTGVGGEAGVTGAGGSGGLPACASQDDWYDNFEFIVAGRNEYVLTSPMNAHVTVTAVDDCATTACEWLLPYDTGAAATDQSTTASRITVSDGVDQWMVFLRLPGMPADVVRIGDTFDMTLDAWLEQTAGDAFNQSLVLARDGTLFVFASAMEAFGDLLLPHLDSFGVDLADAGALCQLTIGCQDRPHAIQVTTLSAAGAIAAGQTTTIGDFSITNGRTIEFGETDCDWKNRSQVGGFRLP